LTIHDLARHPDKLLNAVLYNLNYNYHTALRQGLIVLKDDLLIYCKPIASGMSYTKLILVPEGLHNNIFTAFDANALGGHFNAYVHCIAFGFATIGLGCTPILSVCAQCALVAPVQSNEEQIKRIGIVRARQKNVFWQCPIIIKR
jgi:hypothetical protein